MRTRWNGLTIDCVDPDRRAAFWGALLDRDVERGRPDRDQQNRPRPSQP
ncbi:VOC family protein [Mycolicibacterium sphagni]